jgi:hypothetical protein
MFGRFIEPSLQTQYIQNTTNAVRTPSRGVHFFHLQPLKKSLSYYQPLPPPPTMQPPILYLIAWALLWAIIGYLIAKLALNSAIKDARKHATKQSRSVLLGEVNEKIAPALQGFPYDCKDLVFIGKGIDYLVFDGLASGMLKQIILLEIKSWTSTLNRNERMIKEAIARGKICYEVFRVTI